MFKCIHTALQHMYIVIDAEYVSLVPLQMVEELVVSQTTSAVAVRTTQTPTAMLLAMRMMEVVMKVMTL